MSRLTRLEAAGRESTLQTSGPGGEDAAHDELADAHAEDQREDAERVWQYTAGEDRDDERRRCVEPDDATRGPFGGVHLLQRPLPEQPQQCIGRYQHHEERHAPGSQLPAAAS